MKNFLVVLLVMFLSVPLFAAGEKGEGTCALTPATCIAFDREGEFTWVYTAATTNMSGGIVKITIPTGFPAPVTYTPSSASGLAKIAATTNGTIGTVSVNGQVVTIPITTLNIASIITLKYTAVTPPAGTDQVFTVSVVSATDQTITTQAIASLPTLTRYNNNNQIVAAMAVPTAAVLTTNSTMMNGSFTFVRQFKGGQIVIHKPVGTPGVGPTPNIADFSSNTYSPGYFVVAAGSNILSGSPTVTANKVIIPIATAAAGAAVSFTWGYSQAGGASNYSGGSYVGNAKMNIRANCIGTVAATVTPITTASNSIVFTVAVATPTVNITPVVLNDQSVQIKTFGVKMSDKRVTGAGLDLRPDYNNASNVDIVNGIVPGTYTLTYINGWYDNLNDGTYRTNTATASVTVNPTYSKYNPFYGQYTTNYLDGKIFEGKMFQSSTQDTDFDAAEYTNYHIFVPVGVTANARILINSTGGFYGGLYSNVTVTSVGSTLTARNVNTTSAITTTIKVYANGVTTTAGTLIDPIAFATGQEYISPVIPMTSGTYLLYTHSATENSIVSVKVLFFTEGE